MPVVYLKTSTVLLIGSLVFIFLPNLVNANTFQGIKMYYIRYEIFSLRHKVAKDTLTMVPAQNNQTWEKLSAYTIPGFLTGDPLESDAALEVRVKEQFLKKVLEQKGLKSVRTQDVNTIVTYEALVETPVTIQINSYDTAKGGYPYTAQVNVAPMAFPDQRGRLWTKSKFKRLLNEVIQFFY